MKIVIYSPSCHSNPVWVSFICWTQKMIFWRMLVIKQLMVSIEFHSISFRTMEVNGDKQLLKYLLLCSTEERNLYRFGIKSWWVNVGRLLLEWKNKKKECTKQYFYMKYIFYEKCFTLKQCQNQSHKYKQVVFQIWGWQKKEYDFIWVQYQTFPLDEVHFTMWSF